MVMHCSDWVLGWDKILGGIGGIEVSDSMPLN